MHENAPASWPGPRIAVIARFLGFLGFYRLIVGPGDPIEWFAGAFASALATTGTVVVEAQLLPWRPGPVRIADGPALVLRMLAESLRVSVSALAREMPRGTFDIVPVDPGGDDAASAGRRSLAIAVASLAPNSVAVTLDRNHAAMLVHRLLADRPGPGDRNRELSP